MVVVLELSLDTIEEILVNEKEWTLKEILRNTVYARVVYYSRKQDMITLEAGGRHDFMPGDIIGIVSRTNTGSPIEELGTVVNKWDEYLDIIVSKKLSREIEEYYIFESRRIEICDIEQFINYDLQLDLISFIKGVKIVNNRVRIFNKNAIDLFLSH